jgi:hypothetical protein
MALWWSSKGVRCCVHLGLSCSTILMLAGGSRESCAVPIPQWRLSGSIPFEVNAPIDVYCTTKSRRTVLSPFPFWDAASSSLRCLIQVSGQRLCIEYSNTYYITSAWQYPPVRMSFLPAHSLRASIGSLVTGNYASIQPIHQRLGPTR